VSVPGEWPAGGDSLAQAPAWLREVETAVVTNPQILLYGNVRDLFLIPDGGDWSVLGIEKSLWWCLSRIGYPVMVQTDIVDGLTTSPDTAQGREAATRLLLHGDLPGGELKRLLAPGDRPRGELNLEIMQQLLRQTVRQPEPRPGKPPEPQVPGAVVLDYAARLLRGLPQLDAGEHLFFALCEKLSRTARPVKWADGTARYNPVIWIVNHERELPAWFLAGNDSIRRIAIPMPDIDDRLTAAREWVPALLERRAAEHVVAAQAKRFAEQTQGMTLQSMSEIVRLSRAGTGPVRSIEDATRCYRVGILDTPWGKPALRQRLADANRTLSRRLQGQDEALERSLDIVVRSVMGLSGAQTSDQPTKPRGVLFFAGPTGVGKTELAKALTELIFGDERAYIRFDMSEFSAEHAAERLAGAPPGYLGHDAGGELTNAVRKQPFSLILFDEIEKAHPRVMDKFLQILDDGRLTDGTGATVYFSEAVIVFTSNLGLTGRDEVGELVENVNAGMPRAELEERMITAVKQHFTESLQRPELLNRIGDNIVVFNFISRQVAERIFEIQLDRILAMVLRTQEVKVTVSEAAREELLATATAPSVLEFGGRGIGSQLERAFINPLSRELFKMGPTPGDELTVTDVYSENGQWRIVLQPAGPDIKLTSPS
jgi:energy-coupling factor transporter ATP-binding protein EcfA2